MSALACGGAGRIELRFFAEGLPIHVDAGVQTGRDLHIVLILFGKIGCRFAEGNLFHLEEKLDVLLIGHDDRRAYAIAFLDRTHQRFGDFRLGSDQECPDHG